jgi:DNA-binding transcriptional MerR regulator
VVPRKLYKIGEVMRHTGLSRQTVHNYTVMGLIAEAERTMSGHRLYGEDVFGRLRRIRALQEFMTLQEIKVHLEQEDRVEAEEDEILQDVGMNAGRKAGGWSGTSR